MSINQEQTFPDLPMPRQRGNLGVALFDSMQMHQYALKYADMQAAELAELIRQAQKHMTRTNIFFLSANTPRKAYLMFAP